MSKAKPVLLIVVGILIAGSVAMYISQDNSSQENVVVSAPPAPGGGRIRGAGQAPVTLTEFGDYQCPSCGYYHPIVMELLRRYPEQVKLEFHHFPLIQIHANAMGAAIAAEAAGDQGKFWEMHDLLFERQSLWDKSPNAESVFISMAVQLGLNTNQFQQSIRSPATRDRVLADVTRGRDAAIGGTPTFFINGQQVQGSPGLEELSRIVDSHLKSAAAK